jgi:hypothetical protein
VKSLNKVINPSQNTNPFNHQSSYIKLYTSVKDGTSDKDEFGQLINPRYLDDVFNFATSLPPLTKKVRVDLGRKEYLHMSEVQVFGYDGTNVALNKYATQSSTRSNPSAFVAGYAVDGKINTHSETNDNIGKFHILACKLNKYHASFNSTAHFSPLFLHTASWWVVDLEPLVTVKNVKIINTPFAPERLSRAQVSLIDDAGNYLETSQIGNTKGVQEIDIPFGLASGTTAVVSWKSTPSPTGEPLLTEKCKTQLKAQFQKTMDMFDSSIALVFGNKTTIGQVCSFAKGLKSKTVTNIPGFCCLDAPYQSKIEEWGEKVSLGDALMKETDIETFQQN